jgi:hypothetical protein
MQPRARPLVLRAQAAHLVGQRAQLRGRAPPLGRRVRVPNMHGLFTDLFKIASEVLRPNGRLVFINPLRLSSVDPTLRLESSRTVDLGGYDCRLEVYRKR